MRWQVFGHGIGTYAAGLCLYALCLLILAPATLIDAGLQRVSNDRLRLVEVQGPLWSGAGQLEIRDAMGRSGINRYFAWRFQPQSLLHGRLGFTIDFDQAAKHFSLNISPWGVEIADANFVFPAEALGFALPRLALLEPTGDLLVHMSNFFLTHETMKGEVVVEWRNAGSSLTPVSPLGDYELRLAEKAGGLNASLRTIKGPLHLDGKGSRGKTGAPVFFATARIEPQYERQLAPFLRLIAIERGDGSFEMQLNRNIGGIPGSATPQFQPE